MGKNRQGGNKEYQRYTGYPSGQRRVSYRKMIETKPTQVLKLAVERMMPKNKLGVEMARKLKIYVGEVHPHEAQNPVLLEV